MKSGDVTGLDEQTHAYATVRQHHQPGLAIQLGGVGRQQTAQVEHRQDPATPVGDARDPARQTGYPGQPWWPPDLGDRAHRQGVATATETHQDEFGSRSAVFHIRVIGRPPPRV